jgi:hypothetical protein
MDRGKVKWYQVATDQNVKDAVKSYQPSTPLQNLRCNDFVQRVAPVKNLVKYEIGGNAPVNANNIDKALSSRAERTNQPVQKSDLSGVLAKPAAHPPSPRPAPLTLVAQPKVVQTPPAPRRDNNPAPAKQATQAPRRGNNPAPATQPTHRDNPAPATQATQAPRRDNNPAPATQAPRRGNNPAPKVVQTPSASPSAADSAPTVRSKYYTKAPTHPASPSAAPAAADSAPTVRSKYYTKAPTHPPVRRQRPRQRTPRQRYARSITQRRQRPW